MDSNITEHFELPKTVYLPPETEVTEDLIKALVKMKEKEVERFKTFSTLTTSRTRTRSWPKCAALRAEAMKLST